MTVTIDPSDMRPLSQRQPKQSRSAMRQVLLAGIGVSALAAFTVGAFAFFSDLADPRAKAAKPMATASAWPDLKDGVPALSSPTPGGPAVAATVLNLPRPEVAGPHSAVETPTESTKPLPPVASAPSADTVAASQPVTPEPVADTASDPVAPKPASTASGRTPPPIENADLVTDVSKTVALITPARVAPAIAPSRSESVRARPGELSRFVSLPADPAKVEAAQADTSPEVADQAKPVPTKRSAAAKPAPARPKPAQASAPARPSAPKPVLQASAAPPAQAAPSEADDPEVMGVKIPGGRHVRDGWRSVFGGGTKPN